MKDRNFLLHTTAGFIAGLVIGGVGAAVIPAVVFSLTNPATWETNQCRAAGTLHAQTFTGEHGSLVIPKLTAFDCGNGVIHWRHVPE